MSQLIQQYREQLAKETDQQKIIDIKNNIALELRDSDSEGALSIADETLEASEKLGYEMGIAWAKLNIGFQLDFLGKKEVVPEYLNSALATFKKYDHLPGIAYAYKYLGFHYWGLREVDKAFEMAYLGLEATKGTDTLNEGWAYYELAVFNHDLGKFDVSEKYYTDALRIFGQLNYEHGWGRTYNGFCSIAIKRGEYEKARELGMKALKIHEGSKYNMGLARTYYELGTISSLLKNFDDAVNYLTKCLVIREEVKNTSAIVTTLQALGEAYLGIKDYKKSAQFLLKALSYAEQIKAKSKIVSIRLALIKLYEEKKDLKKVTELYREAFALQSEVYQEDSESKIRSITNKFLAEKKEKEAEIHQLKNVELKNANDQLYHKNEELQLTIDELTRTKIKKKAITITLVLAVILFVVDEGFVDPYIESSTNSIWLSMGIKLLLALLLRPLEQIIERILIRRIIQKKTLAMAQVS